MLSQRLSLTHLEIAVIPESVDTILFAPNHRYSHHSYPSDSNCNAETSVDNCASQLSSDGHIHEIHDGDDVRWMAGWEGVRREGSTTTDIDTSTASSSTSSSSHSHSVEEGHGEIHCENDDIDTCKSLISSSSTSEKTPSPTPHNNRRFVFYSSFKWEHRKGWDLLLDAYWNVFLPTDAVVLMLQTYIPLFLRKQSRPILGFDKDEVFSSSTIDMEGDVMEKIRWYAMKKHNKTMVQLPPVEWVVCPKGHMLNVTHCEWMRAQVVERGIPLLTRPQVRDWLISANAFVLPTRGEGWGLPIAEAMAMELPVIVTNHSGPAAYATDISAYLIPVLDGVTDEKGFAIPDIQVLEQHLRQVVVDSVPQGIAHSKGYTMLPMNIIPLTTATPLLTSPYSILTPHSYITHCNNTSSYIITCTTYY